VSASTTRARGAPRARLERSRPRLTGRAAVLLIAIALLVIMALVPIGRFLEQRTAIADLERRAAELEDRNADLRAEITKLHDPAELEKLARECLGMVATGEVVFLTPGEAPARGDC
jgi:cell division protein FtsB